VKNAIILISICTLTMSLAPNFDVERRNFGKLISVNFVLLSSPTQSAFALDASPTAKLQAGYKGIEYLLANWDTETFKSCPVEQIALRDECERNPEKIPAALGLKSTTAPLFKVEKLFQSVVQTADFDDLDKWTEATDSFVQHSTSAQEYAYTASFGEYNPSGGKDQVAKYMELSRKELILARDALKDVLTLLNVQ